MLRSHFCEGEFDAGRLDRHHYDAFFPFVRSDGTGFPEASPARSAGLGACPKLLNPVFVLYRVLVAAGSKRLQIFCFCLVAFSPPL